MLKTKYSIHIPTPRHPGRDRTDWAHHPADQDPGCAACTPIDSSTEWARRVVGEYLTKLGCPARQVGPEYNFYLLPD
jgi:hypothetical protein